MALSVVTLPVARDVSATTDHFTEGFGEEGERTKFVQFVIILDIQLMPQRGVMAVKWDQILGPTNISYHQIKKKSFENSKKFKLNISDICVCIKYRDGMKIAW